MVDIPAVGSYWLVVGSEPGVEEEGEFEITISCVDTLAPDLNATTVGCTDTLFGTTGTGAHGGSGKRLYELELDAPSGVTLVTECPAGRNELEDDHNPRTFLAIYRNDEQHATSDGAEADSTTCSDANCTGSKESFAYLEAMHDRENLIADSARSVGCGAVLTAHLDGPGSCVGATTSPSPVRRPPHQMTTPEEPNRSIPTAVPPVYFRHPTLCPPLPTLPHPPLPLPTPDTSWW